jgi:hypothetical protein
MPLYAIEDEMHAEMQGEYRSADLAIAELKRRAAIPFDQRPNLCPCKSRRNCGRLYSIITYDDSTQPWVETERKEVLRVSNEGAFWLEMREMD